MSGEQQRDRPASARDVFRQRRELEERRRFGLAPLAVDAVTHAEISTNVPHALTQAPWYFGVEGSTLAHHHRAPREGETADTELPAEEPPARPAPAAASAAPASAPGRFQPGACTNCGALTHTAAQCTRRRRKVAAVYADPSPASSSASASAAAAAGGHKRARHTAESTAGDTSGAPLVLDDTADGGPSDGPGSASKAPRLEGAFAARTAQHGGVEIRPMAKYLHNMNAGEDVFYDPKTGSMRGNPNAADTTNLFQGDLARYRTGAYAEHLEARHRFLTGKSESFVDFSVEERRERERQQQQQQQQKAGEAGTLQERLIDALYGGSRAEAVESAAGGDASSAIATAVDNGDGARDTAKAADADEEVVPGEEQQAPAGDENDNNNNNGGEMLERALYDVSYATRAGHAEVFGSYFDPATFRWGYRCCKRLGVDAPPCKS